MSKRPRPADEGSAPPPVFPTSAGAGAGGGAGAGAGGGSYLGRRRTELDADDRELETRVLQFFEVNTANDHRAVDGTVSHLMGVYESAQRRVASASSKSARLEVKQVCHKCGNADPTEFHTDSRGGDVVCKRCASVVVQHKVHDGDMYRHFEGEEDRSHHGPAPDPLFSTEHNLRTTTGGGSYTATKQLRNIQDHLELNLSNINRDERKTRQGYKEKKKREVFDKLDMCAERLELGAMLVKLAKKLFARFRDDQDQVHALPRVTACCLIAAHRDLRRRGVIMSTHEEKRRAALRVRQGFQCRRCGKYFPLSTDVERHRCAKMSVEEIKARQERRRKRQRLQAKKRRAEEGSLMDFSAIKPKSLQRKKKPTGKSKSKGKTATAPAAAAVAPALSAAAASASAPAAAAAVAR